MSTNPKGPGAGDVEFHLGGERLVLKRTVEVGMWFADRGGFLAVGDEDTILRQIHRLNVKTMAAVIRQGLGVGPSALPDLEQRIFDEGLEVVHPFLVTYIENLRKPLDAFKAEAAAGKANP